MKTVIESVFESISSKIKFYVQIGKSIEWIEEKIGDRLAKLELAPDKEINDAANAIDGEVVSILIQQAIRAKAEEKYRLDTETYEGFIEIVSG